MKGVICAGGLGTRLYPLTQVTNKHLLPIYDKCMVHYPLATLLRAGIDDVMLVTGGPHAGHFLRVLGNGKKLGLRHLEYTYQEKEGGIAEAISLAEEFAEGKPIFVILGDNFTDDDFTPVVRKFRRGAHIFLKAVDNPRDYGIAVFDKKNPQKIIGIEEKPKQPKSRYAVTGFYIYDARIFEFIRKLKPSARGELEITDVNNFYLKANQLSFSELQGDWFDCGSSFESLLRVNALVAKSRGVKL